MRSLTRRCEGHTLIEVLVATVVLALVLTGAATIATRAHMAGRDIPQTIDQQQRARVVLDVLARDIRQAGAGLDVGDHAGPLASVVPAVVPYRVTSSVRTPTASTISTIAVPMGSVQTVLASGLPAGGAVWTLARPVWCGSRPACGARVGEDLMVWDASGAFAIATVDRIGGDAVTVRPLVSPGRMFPAGAPVASVVLRTYSFDAARGQVRVADAGGVDQPLIDGVQAFTVSYEAVTPGGLVVMPPTQLGDGPWLGTGDALFDADLRRVRLVRLRLVLDATDPRVAPLTVSTDVALRNSCLSC